MKKVASTAKPKVQASAPAYKVNDRRSSSGYFSGGSDRLVESSVQQRDRRYIPLSDKDFHRNVTSMGRRTLMTLGRWMFWNVPTVRGMVLEQADLALGTFIPQYAGANKAWGDLAEDWLLNWHKIGDVAGQPFDRDFWLQSQVMLPLVDGDFGTLLTGTAGIDGEPGSIDYPMWQIIPGHRIGGMGLSDGAVKGGPYDGARIVDGVIINDYGRPLAYRVYGDTFNPDDYQDISSRDMILHFVPLFPGQLRGLSGLASSVFNFQDSTEWDRFEMLAQKVFAALTVVETNETGDVDEAKATIRRPAIFNDSNQKTTLDEQTFGGGTVRYFKAGTGSKLEPFHSERPATATQEFQNRKIRDAFRGTQWDAFFSLDPQAVGGAPMRVIVSKINSVLKKLRKQAAKACARVDGYGISKAINNGDLAFDVDWWKWDHQGPGDVTADAKYDSDVAMQEMAQGVSTRKIEAGKRGHYWEDLDAQREAEARSDLQRAQRLATEFKITIQEAMTILRPPTPNGMPSTNSNKNPSTEGNKGNEGQ